MMRLSETMVVFIITLLASNVWAGPLDFEKPLTTDSGKVIKLEQFKGKKVVLAMLYPRCTSACPLILDKLKEIRVELEKRKVDAEFLLVSFDSVDESAQRLREYRTHMALTWPNWTFAFGKERDIRYLSNTLNIRFWRNPKSKDISHDNVILLINEKGNILRRLDGLDAKTAELF